MENKDWREQLPKLVIDLVWSATDGGCKLKESNFSHFGEPIPEWTALESSIDFFLKSKQEEIEKAMEKMKKTQDEVDDNDEGERYYNQAVDDLKPIISNLLK